MISGSEFVEDIEFEGPTSRKQFIETFDEASREAFYSYPGIKERSLVFHSIRKRIPLTLAHLNSPFSNYKFQIDLIQKYENLFIEDSGLNRQHLIEEVQKMQCATRHILNEVAGSNLDISTQEYLDLIQDNLVPNRIYVIVTNDFYFKTGRKKMGPPVFILREV